MTSKTSKPLYETAKAVRVRWRDSTHSTGWIYDHQDSDLRCVSAGLLVDKNRERIKLALSASGQTYGHYLEIPMESVISIKRLR